MVFADKLSWLMEHFNTTNNKLAKAISVDPSLVSKWVNGKRTPPAKSLYIFQIVEFFLKMPHEEYPQMLLTEILARHCAELDLNNFMARRRAMIEWLAEEEPPRIRQRSNQVNAPTVARDGDAPFAGMPGYYETFAGNPGKRQAAIKFLNTVLASGEAVELLLINQESTNWITEDETFFSKWKRLQAELVERGHRFKIIHTVNRDISQITSMISNWLPMHLTGQVESFYHSRYEEPALFKSVFIYPGKIALLTFSTPTSQSEYAFSFEDPTVLHLLEIYYGSYLAQCRPLIRGFCGEEILDIPAEIIGPAVKPGYFYTLRDSLLWHLMPPDLFAAIMERSDLSQTEIVRRMELQRHYAELFQQSVKFNRFREICPLAAVDMLVGENDGVCLSCSYLLVDKIEMTGEELREYLNCIITALEEYENYELVLYNSRPSLMPENTSLYFKEDHYVILSSTVGLPYAIEINEANILHAFEDFFEELYEQIPVNNRSKAWVIKKLKRRIAQIK